MRYPRLRVDFAGVNFSGLDYGEGKIGIPFNMIRKIIRTGNIKAFKTVNHDDTCVNNGLGVVPNEEILEVLNEKPNVCHLFNNIIYLSAHRNLSYRIHEHLNGDKIKENLAKVQIAMKELNAKYKKEGITPFKINDGYCDTWAQTIADEMVEICAVEIWETVFGYADTNHAFLRINGLFYDAECLDGVEDHMSLPIFKKLFKVTKKRQPVWLVDINRPEDRPFGENKRDLSKEDEMSYKKENGLLGTN